MSCMIQDARNTATLANWISKILNCGYEYTGFCAPRSLGIAFMDCCKCGHFDEKLILGKMRRLNYAAYGGRYRETPATDIGDYNPRPIVQRVDWVSDGASDSHWAVMPWHYQIFKFLQFFTYQCCEDATEKTDLYIALKELENDFALFIVQNSQLYQSFGWE